MRAVEMNKGAAHFSFSLLVKAPKKIGESVSGEGDISFRDQSWRSSIKLQAQQTGKPAIQIAEDVIDVGKRQATRLPAGTWSCARVAKFDSPLGSVGFANLTGGPTRSRFDAPVATALGGLSVWRVREILVPTDAAAIVSGTESIDYFISQSDGSLLRKVLRLKGKVYSAGAHRTALGPFTAAGQEDYSTYGETFSVKLPKSCQGK
jgi:hypothetical protein